MSVIASRTWIAAVIVLLAVLALRSTTLDTGLHMDDLAQRAMVHAQYPIERAPWDLYTFSDGSPEEVRRLASTGALPWWSHPNLKLSALRPLSSLLVWFDAVALSPTMAHVHSLLWWLAMVAAAAWTLEAILGRRWAALAVLLYALDDAHVYPLAWLANRAALVSGTFGWLALGVYARSAASERARPVALTLTSIGCLGGGEYGLSALVFTLSYAALLDRRAWSARARGLAPMLISITAYLVWHRIGSFGASHSGTYLDPASDPSRFMEAVFERGPILVLDMLSGLPHPLLIALAAVAGGAVLLALVGLASSWVVARVVVPREQLRTVTWALVCSCLAVVPVCASFLSQRLTVLAALGIHVVLARLALVVVDALADRNTRTKPWTVLGALALLPGLYGHVVVATMSSLEQTRALRAFNTAGSELANAMPVRGGDASDEHWVLLRAADPMTLVYPPVQRWVAGQQAPSRWTVLTLAPGPASMRRVSKRALEVTVAGSWMATPLERFFRDDGLPLHTRVDLDGMRAEVIALDDRGRPLTVRFTFDRGLHDPSMRVWLLGARGFLPYPLAGVGAPMVLPAGLDAVQAHDKAVPAPG